ncbi:HalOD1 output domain-containing protein [Haladaptatus caseinilyticus]|uniref:HalOD1 output domain-containing protein n=1 Tax=Haladaptatus caseinilyticus TaxID=2993314 RepID=UPI00224A906B|nr:HalOD1 output domain-containing protein [Haladaptatus caseinilyticus]
MKKGRRTKSIQTANWFAAETEQLGDDGVHQYTLVAPFTMDPTRPVSLCVADAVTAVAESSGQTALTLYEYLDPDGLDEIVEASSDKRSEVEIRFTVEEYLIIVRSPHTILVYEPEEKTVS